MPLQRTDFLPLHQGCGDLLRIDLVLLGPFELDLAAAPTGEQSRDQLKVGPKLRERLEKARRADQPPSETGSTVRWEGE